jgi:hypothetical protein
MAGRVLKEMLMDNENGVRQPLKVFRLIPGLHIQRASLVQRMRKFVASVQVDTGMTCCLLNTWSVR